MLSIALHTCILQHVLIIKKLHCVTLAIHQCHTTYLEITEH